MKSENRINVKGKNIILIFFLCFKFFENLSYLKFQEIKMGGFK